MKKVIFVVALIVCLSSDVYSQNKDTFSYHVPGIVPVLKQKDDMACWITVATMMLSWRENGNYTVDELAAKLGDPWKLYYDTNTGLPASAQTEFTKKIRLKEEPPANYILNAYREMLRRFGPLWIITGDELGAHARLITGVEGDGSYEHSLFIIIDPKKGKSEKQNALDFLREFEEEAKVANREKWKEDFRIQIYHF